MILRRGHRYCPVSKEPVSFVCSVNITVALLRTVAFVLPRIDFEPRSHADGVLKGSAAQPIGF